jgi:hypothetical protein
MFICKHEKCIIVLLFLNRSVTLGGCLLGECNSTLHDKEIRYIPLLFELNKSIFYSATIMSLKTFILLCCHMCKQLDGNPIFVRTQDHYVSETENIFIHYTNIRIMCFRFPRRVFTNLQDYWAADTID